MADPIALPPQAPKALQDSFNTFVAQDLWRYASDGGAPKEQLRQYLKDNPEVLKYNFTDSDGKPTNILMELSRLEKDQLAIMMLQEYELPKGMIAGQKNFSPLEASLKKGQSGLARILIDKGADLGCVIHGDTHLLQLVSMGGGASLMECIDKKMPAAEMQTLLKSYCALPVNMGERPSMFVPLLQKHKIAKEDTDRFASKWEEAFTKVTYDKNSRSFVMESQFCDEPFIPPVTHKKWVDEFALRDMSATMLALQKAELAKAPVDSVAKTLIGFTHDEFYGSKYLEQIKTLMGNDQKRKDSFLTLALQADEMPVAKTLVAAGAKGQAVSLFEAIWAEKPKTIELLLDSGVKLDSKNATNIGSPADSNNQPVFESTLIYHWASKDKFENTLRLLAQKGAKPKDDESYYKAVEIALSDNKKAALVGILQQSGLPFPAQGKNKQSLLEAIEKQWTDENTEWAKNNPGQDRFTTDPSFPQMIIDRANIRNTLEQWKSATPQRNNSARLDGIQLDSDFRLADGTKAPELPADILVMKKRVIAA